MTWSGESKQLFVTAEEQGWVKPFQISVGSNELPVALTDEGCISSLKTSGNGLFVTSSTFTDSCQYTTLDPSLSLSSQTIHSTSSSALSSAQISEIWYPSTNSELIHAFIVTPTSFDPSQKCPIIFLTHGGPQYAWHDDFPIEGIYNPLLFSAQGYIVLLPNITGSTGYGQNFRDSIRRQWGGEPYQDLENGFKYVKGNLPYADTNRVVGTWRQLGRLHH
jgi:pre-mRNA-splicing helicase BRR2